MLATFSNKLEAKRLTGSEECIVNYSHSLRCPVDVWFERSYKNKYGWVMQFKATSNSVLKEFRSDLFKQAIQYIERRQKSPVTDITFEDILSMADAIEINRVAA